MTDRSTVIQIRNKGSLTLPVELRRRYQLEEGDVLTLIDLGDGAFLLTPRSTRIDRIGERISQAMLEEGVSLDELLAALDEEREHYYQERYVKD
jgi:bifunctional DNA-binding transcriptional regulator/antitoxin component of YhaV-PrlF toxin-antitoxin module